MLNFSVILAIFDICVTEINWLSMNGKFVPFRGAQTWRMEAGSKPRNIRELYFQNGKPHQGENLQRSEVNF